MGKGIRWSLLLLALAAAVALFVYVFFGGGLPKVRSVLNPQTSAVAPTPSTPMKNEFTFSAVSLSGYTDTSTYAGKNGTLNFYAGWSDSFYQPYEAPYVVLQQNTGDSWETVKKVELNSKDTIITQVSYGLKPDQTKQKVQYRYAVLPTKTAAGFSWPAAQSAPVTVTWENQDKYTGLQKTMYNYIKNYCPDTVVHIVKAVKGNEDIGYYHSGGYLIDILKTASGYPTQFRKSVALHECAHERQFLNWGSTADGWEQMKAAAAEIFTNDTTPTGVAVTPHGEYKGTFIPLEHAADCAALSVNPKGYLGYGGYCSPSELAAGKQLMAGAQF